MTTKPISIKEDLYNQLDEMKTKSLRSFSDVICDLINKSKELEKIKKDIGDLM